MDVIPFSAMDRDWKQDLLKAMRESVLPPHGLTDVTYTRPPLQFTLFDVAFLKTLGISAR